MTASGEQTRLTIHLLGSPRFQLAENRDLDIRMTKSKAILAYLAATGEVEFRATLAGMLWSDMLETSARANLRAAITSLRKELGDFLLPTRQKLGLNPALDIWVDVREVERLWRLWQSSEVEQQPSIRTQLRNVLSGVQDEFLASFNIPDAPLFEEWILLERERYNQLIIDALTAMATYAIDHLILDEGIEDAAQILRLDPWRESAHRHLIHLFALQGHRAAALNQFEKCRELLRIEFDVQPEASTIALVEKIRRGAIEPVPTEPAPRGGKTGSGSLQKQDDASENSSELGLPPHNIPNPTTLFFGRQDTLAEIKRLLVEESSCQLLTLVGPGGIGKTRLALEAAYPLLEHFRQGIYFVSFSSVSRSDQIVPTIAEALHFSFYGDVNPQIQLIQYLNGKQMLLIFDNFEHLVEEADFLTQALQNSPELRIMLTSQERLNLHEEWVLTIDGLSFPHLSKLSDWTPEDVERLLNSSDDSSFLGYSALELFVQRAKLVRSDFKLTKEELPAVIRICEMVDGTPLGIELSAAWVKMFGCNEIAAEIAQNLDFLTSSLRNLPQRHRSLRAVFNHAWSLLTPAEREVFQRLAVFSGSFDRQAAQEIASASALDLVALVDKSLVHNRESGQFVLHGQLKQYATEHLSQNSSELADLRQRHCLYFARYLHDRNQELKGGIQKEAQEKALAEIVAVMEEVRDAWRWAILHNQLTQIEMMLDSLFRTYEMRSLFQEGVESFGSAIDRLSSAATGATAKDEARRCQILGKLLARQGWFQFQLGQSERGRELLERALEFLAGTDEQSERIFVLNYLGAIHRDAGEYERAADRLQESLQICRSTNELFGHTVALNILGNVSYLQGNYEEARRLCLESLEIKRAIGDRWGVRFSLSYLGAIAGLQANYQEAEQLFRESLAIAEAIDDRRGMANCLGNLGNVVASQGFSEDAKRFYQRSLHIYSQIGNELGVITAHTQLGELATKEAEHGRGWTHFRTALQKAQTIGSIPAMLDVLLGVALFKKEMGQSENALEILHIIRTQPAVSRGTKDRAAHLVNELAGGSSLAAGATAAGISISSSDEVQDERSDEKVTELVANLLEADA